MSSLTDKSKWTYGAELELSDFDRRRGFPDDGQEWKFDKRDITMVNSNGVAVWMGKPQSEADYFGGEINTPPTKTIKEQVNNLRKVVEFYPEATINYRSNLHIHIRIPGLSDNLKACKRIQAYVHKVPDYLDTIEPIPRPKLDNFESEEEYEGAVRRFNRRQVSHHKMLTGSRLKAAQRATNFDDFYAAEAPVKDGKPLMHRAPRCAVNIRQLKETDTIEFRHFPGTLDPIKFGHCLRWCRDFLYEALTSQKNPITLFEEGEYDLPKFKKYIHWMEVGYRMTVHDGSVSKQNIEKNKQKILDDPEFLKEKTASLNVLGSMLPKLKNPDPKIFQLRGTSGSGKSTVVFNILHNYGGEPLFGPTGARPIGYIVKKLKLFIVGGYQSPTGGCDSIKTVHHTTFRVLSAYNQGYNVLFEGLLLSGLVDVAQKLSQGRNAKFYFLSAPLEVCLKRVKSRRAARGEVSEMNPKNTVDKFKAVKSSFKTLSGAGLNSVMVKNSEAYVDILNELGIEYPVDFDPHPQSSYGEPVSKKRKVKE